ncbi:hypothetical protein [Thermogymnomonas acidicola]|uniref:hypothetical protein n=1 Tax=Thermogymnomonas acidicola TaxID=399579 RepID=UPI0009467B86|nr:hypothetical protein [Thermogymnomonas acidicola]
MLIDLEDEAQRSLAAQDIDRFIRLKDRKDQIEKDLRSFLQKRFEKILIAAIYELDSATMESLTQEEREIILEIHNLVQDRFDAFLLKRKQKEPEQQVVEEHGGAGEEEKAEEQAGEPMAEAPGESGEVKYVLIRVLSDQPPIAQEDRDYYLHENDILYVPEEFAEILVKRGAAIPIRREKAVTEK